MTSTATRTFARYLAAPVVSAGIIGAAALGLAGVANAAEVAPQPQPGMVATPQIYADPAPQAEPGWRWHHGVYHLPALEPTAIQ